MKPFGVRLAAGAVTILLGAIMAAQAQKDHQAEIDSAWSPDLKTAPTELLPMQGTWASDQSDPAGPGLELSPFDDVQDAVQLVQHTEPVIEAPPTFSVPDAAATAAEKVTNALMSLPDTSLPDPIGSNEPQTAPVMDFPDPIAGAPAEALEAVNRQAANLQAANLQAGMGAPSLDMLAQNVPANINPLNTNPANTNPANLLRGAAETTQPLRAAPPESNVINPTTGQLIRSLGLPGESQSMPAAAQPDPQAANDLRMAQNAISPQLPMPTEDRFVPDNRDFQGAPANNALQGNAGQNQFRQNDFVQNQTPDPRYAQPNGYDPNINNQALQYDPNADYNRNAPPPLPENNRRPQFRGTAALPAAHTLPKGNYAPVPTADQVRGTGTYGQPGDRRLEGIQSPSVVIHKRAPSEVKVGKVAQFVIHVQNVGSAEALNVRVHDRVPQGMRMADATPRPDVAGNDGEYVWNLGALGAGEERQVTLQLVPEQEGELGSVARVTFEAAASVRTRSTRPLLKITQRTVKEVLIGQQLEIELEISNPGTGEATGVMLQEDVPEGLDHPKGRQLDNLIGTLGPGVVRRQMLRLKAVSPGPVKNTIRLKGDDGLETSHTVAVNVIAPQLQVALTGPRVRYLERQATFMLDIANSGTARAENVEIAAFLDRGFTFVSTENEGTYDPSRHAVYWSVENLPVNARDQIPLVLLPVQEGARAIQLEAKADLGIVAQNETQVAVNSLAELTFSISDTSDPIEIGGITTYEIRVKNSGSRPDRNVQVQLQLPQGVKFISSESDAQQPRAGTIAFRPRDHLAANGEIVYQIKTQGVLAGTHLIEAVVNSQESRIPVKKQESTMVYDDRANIATQPRGGAPQFQR